MASHLKRYGKYWVFAAMTAAGAYVWDSSRRDHDGRSFAEVFNAAAERALVPALSGDEVVLVRGVAWADKDRTHQSLFGKDRVPQLRHFLLGKHLALTVDRDGD